MNLHLGRLLGIDVKIHWTFWFLPLFILFSGNTGSISVGMHLGLLFAMFACVVMHEYGHALAARRYGIRTRDVTLYPIGGVANLERISERPREELVIAIAGPLVNVAIVGVLIGVMYVKTRFDPVFVAEGHLVLDQVDLFLTLLAWLNVGMVLFNMIPAFPLDGGRVLRALLAFKFERLRATRIAVRIGAVLIFSLAFLSFFFTQSLWLGIIGMFLYFAGRREVAMLEYRDWLRRQAEHQTSWQLMFENMFQQPAHPSDDDPGDDADDTFVWDPRSQAWVREGHHEPPRHIV
ncbi:MAG: site-2 protease family protein [Gemmataceae bacterium]|nr:site-2 protease family protein [Gemmataceae bacterium]